MTEITVQDYFEDRAYLYAKDIVDGKLLAGPIVRAACNRHLADLKQQLTPDFPYYYDCKEAAKTFRFFETILFLNGGQFEGKPFILFPWEAFVLGSIFGWKRQSDQFRRFRVAYIETPKGSGKSPIAGGVGIKGLVADNEPRAEIYAAATHKDQAMILFRDAIAFYDQSPELRSRLTPSGTGEKRWNLAYLEKGSFFRPISSENKGKSGPRPHFVLLDEIHEHKDDSVIEMLRAGFKFRRQPLSFMITNSGHDKASVCFGYHEMGRKVCDGSIKNEEFFAYICSLDEEDMEDEKYLTDESLWEKVNPSLIHGLPGHDYIRSQVNEARGMPSKMATVRRLCFCQWVESLNPWLSQDVWIPCRDRDAKESIYDNRRCWGGLDLSSVNDLTAFALLFEPTPLDPYARLKVFFWCPEEGLHEKSKNDHVPYDIWVDNGYVFKSQGRAISKGDVVMFIDQMAAKYNIQGVAYDRNRIKDLIEMAEVNGIDLAIGKWNKDKRVWDFDSYYGIKMLPFGQQASSMAPAIDKFETLLLQRQIRHDGNPCLSWNAANVVVEENNDGYRHMVKKKSYGRIDGIVAAVMACGVMEDGTIESAYEGMTSEQITERIAL